MNRIFSMLIVAALFSATASSQTLGDVARQNRQTKRKPAARVITNDDIKESPASSEQQTPAKSDDQAEKQSGTKEAAPAKETNPAETTNTATEKGEKDLDEASKKAGESFKTKISEQKGKVDLLQRELDVLEKENQLQIARYYQDAGSQLRDTKAWSEQQQKNQETIDTKKKALQEAKDQLEAVRDEGRKAGVPSSYLE